MGFITTSVVHNAQILFAGAEVVGEWKKDKTVDIGAKTDTGHAV